MTHPTDDDHDTHEEYLERQEEHDWRKRAEKAEASLHQMSDAYLRATDREAEIADDRDEWRTQHDNALACWHADVAIFRARAEKAEAELARLREGLERLPRETWCERDRMRQVRSMRARSPRSWRCPMSDPKPCPICEGKAERSHARPDMIRCAGAHVTCPMDWVPEAVWQSLPRPVPRLPPRCPRCGSTVVECHLSYGRHEMLCTACGLLAHGDTFDAAADKWRREP